MQYFVPEPSPTVCLSNRGLMTPVTEEKPRSLTGILIEEGERDYNATGPPRTDLSGLPPSTITPAVFIDGGRKTVYKGRVSKVAGDEVTDGIVGGNAPSHSSSMATAIESPLEAYKSIQSLGRPNPTRTSSIDDWVHEQRAIDNRESSPKDTSEQQDE